MISETLVPKTIRLGAQSSILNSMAIIVDDAFIETWHPRYDLTESDQAEYDSLIAQVAMEVRSSGTISKETFLAIWRWKGAMRVIGLVRLDHTSATPGTIMLVILSGASPIFTKPARPPFLCGFIGC